MGTGAATARGQPDRELLRQASIFPFEKKGGKKIKMGVELFCNKRRSAPRSCNFLLHQDGENHSRPLQSAGMLQGCSAPRSWVLPEWQLSLFNQA